MGKFKNLDDIRQMLGLKDSTTIPRRFTAYCSIFGLLWFTLALALSAWACKHWSLFFVGGLGGAISLVIIALVIYDIRKSCETPERKKYSRNLANTVLNATMAINVIGGIYIGIWYGQRTGTTFILKQDVVEGAQYPAVVLFQESDWWAQGKIRAGGSKCFINSYDDASPNCTDLGAQSIDNINSCNCANLWSEEITENFQYRNRTYRYLELRTNQIMMCTRPTTLLWLQAFFDYDADKAESKEGFIPSPGLSLAIFDPQLNLSSALESNYTRMIDINALGSTSINLDLFYRINLDATAAYDYKVTISSTPSLNLVCNIGSNGTSYSGPCATRLLLRISSFHRTILEETKGISWSKIVNSAGAWYSLVQFVSWVVSGSATDKGLYSR